MNNVSRLTKVSSTTKKRGSIRGSAIRFHKYYDKGKFDYRHEEELKALEKEFARLSRKVAQLSNSTYETSLKNRIEDLRMKLHSYEEQSQFKELHSENQELDYVIAKQEAKIKELNNKHKKLEEKIKVLFSNSQQDSLNVDILKRTKGLILAKLFRTRYVVGLGEYKRIKTKLKKELNEYKELLNKESEECDNGDKKIAELEKKIEQITHSNDTFFYANNKTPY